MTNVPTVGADAMSQEEFRVSIQLSAELLCSLEACREQLGLQSSSDVVRLILEQVLLNKSNEDL